VDAYLNKTTVSGEYLVIYLTTEPIGKSSAPTSGSVGGWDEIQRLGKSARHHARFIEIIR
jgi:hypothetical protein